MIFRQNSLARFARCIVDLGILFGVLFSLFYLTWGFNYFREPLKERMELNVCARSVEELGELTVQLAARANSLRERIPEDRDGVAKLDKGFRAVFDEMPDAFKVLKKRDSAFDHGISVTRAKTVAWSRGLSWCGITGIYIGITAEPNVNVDAPAFLLPHTAAHEMAHQLGIASEDEAEFVGYLACLSSTDLSVKYSGVLAALIDCGNALYAQDSERYRLVFATYSDGLIRDLQHQKAYWDAFEGEAEKQATKANDSYLKHHGQESGVQSYGEAVDLLLAYHEKTNFLAWANPL